MNLSDLPDLIGISKAMFYAYRKGASRISGKVWARLEEAERAAGIGGEAGGTVVSGPPAEYKARDKSMEDLLRYTAATLEGLAAHIRRSLGETND